MTTYNANPAAEKKSRSLIASNQYVIDSVWSDSKPSSNDQNAYLKAHGWNKYAQWFLAIDPDANEQTKGRFHFPFGDFRRVHRSGLIAAKQRAAQNGQEDVEALADRLLQFFDKTTK